MQQVVFHDRKQGDMPRWQAKSRRHVYGALRSPAAIVCAFTPAVRE
jgi:hypothetical protein